VAGGSLLQWILVGGEKYFSWILGGGNGFEVELIIKKTE